MYRVWRSDIISEEFFGLFLEMVFASCVDVVFAANSGGFS